MQHKRAAVAGHLAAINLTRSGSKGAGDGERDDGGRKRERVERGSRSTGSLRHSPRTSFNSRPNLAPSRRGLGDVWPPSLSIMTRPPVIFYFTCEAKEKEDLPGLLGEEEAKLPGSEGGNWKVGEGEECRGGK